MNASRPARCSTLLLMAALSCAIYAGEGQAGKTAAEFQLEVNDEQFPVFFEDQSLTDDEANAIVADYQVLVQELAPVVGRYQFRRGQIQRAGSTISLTSIFGFTEKHLKRPYGYEQELGIIGKTSDEKEYIVIQKKLSEGYRAAMALKKEHEEACRLFPSFLALLNNLTEAQLPPVEDFLYLHGQAKKFSDTIASWPKRRIIEEHGRFRYTCVSMLDFRLFEGRFAATVYAMNKDNGHVYRRPMIYDDSRWKIVITIPGT